MSMPTSTLVGLDTNVCDDTLAARMQCIDAKRSLLRTVAGTRGVRRRGRSERETSRNPRRAIRSWSVDPLLPPADHVRQRPLLHRDATNHTGGGRIPLMKIGVYVDGYNLYYGGRGICGRGQSGWRWLDIRSMARDVISAQSGWQAPLDLRVVYCTARIRGRGNVSGQRDQDVYLRALQRHGAVDVIEFGTYVERISRSPLATPDRRGRPVLATAQWPVVVKDASGTDVPNATFIASVARREEKGSDVNVATHLLVDVLNGNVDAAVVVSNDSDLKTPIEIARTQVPVGLVNPTKGYPAGALNASPTIGAGGHWWYQLTATDFTTAQMPPTVGQLSRPNGW